MNTFVGFCIADGGCSDKPYEKATSTGLRDQGLPIGAISSEITPGLACDYAREHTESHRFLLLAPRTGWKTPPVSLKPDGPPDIILTDTDLHVSISPAQPILARHLYTSSLSTKWRT